MQDNRSNRVDRGWDKMFPILEAELPQKEEKRRALWLFLWPALLVGIGIGAWLLMPDSNTANKIEPYPLNQKLTPTTESKSEKLLVENNNHKSINEEPTSVASNVTTPISNIITTSTQPIKSTAQIIKEAPATKKSVATIFTQTPTSNYSPAVTKKSVSLAAASPTTSTTPKSIDVKNDRLTLETLSPLVSLGTLIQYDRNNFFPITFQPELFSEPILPAEKNQLQKWVPSIALSGFHAHQLNTLGPELNLGLIRKNNKVGYGITLGAGYQLNDKANMTTADSLEEILLSNDNSPTGVANEIGLSGSNSGTFEDNNNVLDTSVDSRITTLNRLYFKTGAFFAYQLSSKVSLGIHAGIEYYDFTNQNEDGSRQTVEATGAELPTLNSLLPYNELQVSYGLSDKLQLGVAYRYSHKDLFKTSIQRQRAHKYLLSLNYRI